MAPPTATGTAEMELAERARAGDSHALAELYERYRQPIYRHAWRMLRSDAAAQDVVQEAFARAIAAISKTRRQLRFKAWLYRIATNLCLRQLRKGRRVIRSERSTTEVVDLGADPERERRRSELAALVTAALDGLPARYRQILLLREIEELSYDEIAEVLGSDVNRVKVTLHRARSRFAALFLAEQLQANRHGEVPCRELRHVLDAGRSTKQLVRHLETCKQCRRRERRPAAELFSLLPAPLGSAPSQPPRLPRPSASLATAGAMTAAAAAVVGGVVAAVLISAAGDAPANKRPARSSAAARAEHTSGDTEQGSPDTGRAAATTAPLGASAPLPAPVGRDQAPAARRTRRSLALARSLTRDTTRVPAKARPGRRAPPRPTPAPPREGDGDAASRAPGGAALRVRVVHPPGSVVIHRGQRSVLLRRASDLRLGDVLRTRPGTSLGMRLPGRQWLVVEGSLRLDRLPLKGAANQATGVQVSLLRGALRARGTRPGHGITVTAGKSAFSARGAELRLRRAPAGTVAECLSGYVQVEGPHAARVLPPASRLRLGQQPGFAHGLLAPPTGLRPIAARTKQPPHLRWEPVAGARSYRVQIARDAAFIEMAQSLTVSSCQARPSALPPGKYFWQAIAQDDTHLGRPSKVYAFVIER